MLRPVSSIYTILQAENPQEKDACAQEKRWRETRDAAQGQNTAILQGPHTKKCCAEYQRLTGL